MPEAWLLTVARRSVIDADRRRRSAAEDAADHLALVAEELEAAARGERAAARRAARADVRLRASRARPRDPRAADPADDPRLRRRGDRLGLPRLAGDDGPAPRAREEEDPRGGHPVPGARRRRARRAPRRRARGDLRRVRRGLVRPGRHRRAPPQPRRRGHLARPARRVAAARRSPRRSACSRSCSTRRRAAPRAATPQGEYVPLAEQDPERVGRRADRRGRGAARARERAARRRPLPARGRGAVGARRAPPHRPLRLGRDRAHLRRAVRDHRLAGGRGQPRGRDRRAARRGRGPRRARRARRGRAARRLPAVLGRARRPARAHRRPPPPPTPPTSARSASRPTPPSAASSSAAAPRSAPRRRRTQRPRAGKPLRSPSEGGPHAARARRRHLARCDPGPARLGRLHRNARQAPGEAAPALRVRGLPLLPQGARGALDPRPRGDVYPCPKSGTRFRPRRPCSSGGKAQFPYLVDPNTGDVDVRVRRHRRATCSSSTATAACRSLLALGPLTARDVGARERASRGLGVAARATVPRGAGEAARALELRGVALLPDRARGALRARAPVPAAQRRARAAPSARRSSRARAR